MPSQGPSLGLGKICHSLDWLTQGLVADWASMLSSVDPDEGQVGECGTPECSVPSRTKKNNCSAVKTIYFALQKTNSCLQSANLSHSLGWRFCWIQPPLGFPCEQRPCQTQVQAGQRMPLGARPCPSGHFHDPEASLMSQVPIPLTAVTGGHQGLWASSWESQL